MLKHISIILLIIFSLNSYGQENIEKKFNFDFFYYFEKNFPLGFFDLESSENFKFISVTGDIIYLKNDFNNESFINLTIFQKENKFFHVIAWNTAPMTYIGLGSISEETPIYVFLREMTGYSSDFRLYNTPSYDSYFDIIDIDISDPARIIDVNGRWLKIETKSEGKHISGWIPYEEQCGNVYTTCN